MDEPDCKLDYETPRADTGDGLRRAVRVLKTAIFVGFWGFILLGILMLLIVVVFHG
jgi:hypothetical protein